jgi:hypothetical protein
MLLPGTVAADPWTDFETRCLSPMENLHSLVSADFGIEHDKPEFTVHRWLGDDVSVQVTTYKTTARRQSCVAEVLDPSQWPDTLTAFELWRAKAIADQRYEVPGRDIADGTPAGGNAVYSNEIREPRLRVGFIALNEIGGPAIFAEDTDLES